MIRYTLRCDRGHGFESWFQSSAAYDSQVKRRLVNCPNCGSVKVEKAIMAPQIGKKGRVTVEEAAAAPSLATDVGSAPAPLMMAQEAELRAKIKQLRDHVTKNADNVGEKFPDEARKMHYGDIEHRPIYGEASPDEARSLIDEGIEVSPLPVLPAIGTDMGADTAWSWQFWALLSAVFAALTAIFAKIGVSDIDSDLATFIRTIVVLTSLAAILLATGKFTGAGPISTKTWIFLVLSGLGTGASWLCYFRALKLGPASLVAPIDKLSVVFVALFAVGFLGERPSLNGWLGIALIAAGAVLIAFKA